MIKQNILNSIKIKGPKLFFILLLLCLTFLPHSLNAAITSDEEFNTFFTYYYSNSQPDKVPQALEYFLKSKLFRGNLETNSHVIEMVAYFFGRVANINPELLRNYEKHYDLEDMSGKLFLISIFTFASDEQNKAFFKERLAAEKDKDMRNLLTKIIDKQPEGSKRYLKDVRDFNQLDFLWMEFFITGDKEPIVKLIDVLSWKDRFKQKLDKWLVAKPSNKEKKKLSSLLNNEVKMGIDLDKYPLEPNVDLDCVYSAYLQGAGFNGQRSKSGQEIREILGLSDEDIFYMATKGAAMWALQFNAKQHPKVLEYCKQEFQNRNDKSKIELAIILELASKGSIECLPTEKEGVVSLKLREENN